MTPAWDGLNFVIVLYICIPAYNEAPTIGVLLWRIRATFQEYSREYELIVYDDASTDSTRDTLEPYREVLPLTVIGTNQRRGYAAALDACCREVTRKTRYPRRDAMIVMQADFTDSPEHIPDLVKRFEGGADIVVADRSKTELPPRVRLMRKLSALAVRRFAGITGVNDPFSSFRLYRISVVRDVMSARKNDPIASTPGPLANLQLLLAASPFARRVESVPIPARYDLRMRESRVQPFADALKLYRFMFSPRESQLPAAVPQGGAR